MDRRTFLRCGSASVLGTALGVSTSTSEDAAAAACQELFGPRPPAFSIIPVVGDGRWIWKRPPEKERGYLEPRDYKLSVGIQLQGTGPASRIQATTVVPVELPEQKIDDVQVLPLGSQAGLRQLAPAAGQLMLSAPGIARGQTISAVATYHLRLYKEYHAYSKEQFPASQQVPRELAKQYLGDSPGIETRANEVRSLATDIAFSGEHPWDQAHAYYDWVWQNIRSRPGKYTSVTTALRDRVGDCEERAAVFVALCRSAGIPARLVWVPNHNWAEFCLVDEDGQPRWIPAHTSCYSWFGWTGAHELVLQKGDRIRIPGKRQKQRLVADWAQWQGARPKIRWAAELMPLPPEVDADAGPGHRRKDEKGEWVVVGQHELDPYLRDGDRAASRGLAEK